jgi:hypothetical protein
VRAYVENSEAALDVLKKIDLGKTGPQGISVEELNILKSTLEAVIPEAKGESR